MTDKHYAIARALAGEWAARSIPVRYHLGRGIPRCLPEDSPAIYITELSNGRTAYVGQTRQRVADRLRQHAGSWERASRWTWVWIVPLLDEVPKEAFNRIEGSIGAWLRPVDCLRLPRVGTPRTNDFSAYS